MKLLRRYIYIFVLFFYLFLSTGFVVNLHYCQHELKSIAIYTSSENCCSGTCKMDKKCCEDKQIVIQMDSQDKIVPSVTELSHFLDYLESFVINFDCLEREEPQVSLLSLDLPPPKIDIWKINCTFLYYG
jgi:hypothetical protein